MHDDEMSMRQWFALAVSPRFDQAVARTLEANGYETFVPVYHKRRREETRARDMGLPVFPGYVCCRFNVSDQPRVLMTPGVVQVLGEGNAPVALDQIEITSLQTAIRAQLRIEPFPFLQTGQRIRIEGGVLGGIEGIVMGFKEKLRLVLSVTLLQKSVLLEITREQVAASVGSSIMNIGAAGGV